MTWLQSEAFLLWAIAGLVASFFMASRASGWRPTLWGAAGAAWFIACRWMGTLS